MKHLSIVLVSLAVACSSSSGGFPSTPSLDGNWAYVDAAGTAGAGATFQSDGTYVLTILQITSSASANASLEKGSFTTSGTTLTLTPKESSCPGPDAVYTMGYSFQGSNLELAEPSGDIVFQPNTATASSIAITDGCFNGSGDFTASPLAPVTN